MTVKRTSPGTRAASRDARGARARTLRIVGGAWRSRLLRFPAGSDIRPTPDRVRETLFNWLAPHIAGAKCLDLFAGSGALGLEALSRGAAECVFVERDRAAADELQRLLLAWRATNAQVLHTDAARFLQGKPRAFDVVFLDPPFASRDLLTEVAARLDTGGWVALHARIYVECAARDGLPALPAAWQPLKSGRAGEVGYHLLANEA